MIYTITAEALGLLALTWFAIGGLTVTVIIVLYYELKYRKHLRMARYVNERNLYE